MYLLQNSLGGPLWGQKNPTNISNIGMSSFQAQFLQFVLVLFSYGSKWQQKKRQPKLIMQPHICSAKRRQTLRISIWMQVPQYRRKPGNISSRDSYFEVVWFDITKSGSITWWNYKSSWFSGLSTQFSFYQLQDLSNLQHTGEKLERLNFSE